MIDPATAYTIHMNVPEGDWVVAWSEFVAVGVFPPSWATNARWLPMPLDQGNYAFFYLGTDQDRSIAQMGYALTVFPPTSNWMGSLAILVAFGNDLAHAFKLAFSDDGSATITSALYIDGPLTARNVKGIDFFNDSAGHYEDDYYALYSAPNGVGPVVGSTMRFADPVPCGTLPPSRGAVKAPLADPPLPAGPEADMPERLPADPAEDPLWGETVIPFFAVSGDLPVQEQMQHNPYYLMSHYRYWKRIGWFPWLGGPDHTQAVQRTVGFTSTTSLSLTDTLGITVESDGGFKLGGASLGLSTKLVEELGITLSQSDQVLVTEQLSDTYHFADKEQALICAYGLAHRYELWRGDLSTQVAAWEAVSDSETMYTNYPRDKEPSGH